MAKVLSSNLTMVSTDGNRVIPLNELDAVSVPSGPSDFIEREPDGFDGWTKNEVPVHLRKWTPGKEAYDVMEKVEEAIARGLPNARRRQVRNLHDGILDERWIPELSRGEDIDAPYWKWNKRKSGIKRVAICFDAALPWFIRPEVVSNRMNVCMGLGAALELAGYPVSIVGGVIQTTGKNSTRSGPRLKDTGQKTIASMIVVKGENESLVPSNFAHFADTGLTRLIRCWVGNANGYSCPLSNREWREICDADFYVGITGRQSFNSQGLPYDDTPYPSGPDTLKLLIDEEAKDIRQAIQDIIAFFEKANEE